MKRLTMTQEAAREVVAAGTEGTERACYDAPPFAEGWTPPTEARPCRLRSAWRKTAEGIWSAKAVFLDAGAQSGNSDALVDVYSVAGGSPPEGDPYEWTFYAVWRGRWESTQQPVERKAYIAGDAISVGIYDSELGGIPIVNMGVCRAQIAGESRQETKTLYFSPIWFKWIPSSLDIAGKREVAIKAKTVDVVTDIVNGAPVKKKIVVLVGADGS